MRTLHGTIVSFVVGMLFAALPSAAATAAPPPMPDLVASGGGPLGPYTPPACVAGVPFADVTCTTPYDGWIEQFARDGITGGCGGGNYCPGTAVTRDQMAVFVERAMRGTANWPAHTQLVWAVKDSTGAPDPVASGGALLNAVAAIPTSGNDAPSSTNPWLVKIGPGVFNLGSSGLSLPAYVNLDGAGMNSTTITAANDTWFTVESGAANTISNVAVTNFGTGANTYAIYAVNSTATLDHVFVRAVGGTNVDVAVLVNSSDVTLYDGEISSGEFGVYTTGSAIHTIQAYRTLFGAAADVYNAGGYYIQLAYAKVPDQLNNFNGGVFQCIGNYDSNLAPVTCP